MNSSTNYDQILEDVKQINKKFSKYKNKSDYKSMSFEDFKNQMGKEHNELHSSFNFIFNRAVSGNLDTNVFTYMIKKAKAVQKNKMSNFDASKQVGQKLVDTFVKPSTDKDTSPSTDKDTSPSTDK
jgi:hypothetical protein